MNVKPFNELTPFGVFVRNLRSNRGESIEGMCEKLNVRRTYLTPLETGVYERVTRVPIYLIARIKQAYNLSPRECIELIEAVKETNDGIQRLSLNDIPIEDKEKILNYAYTLMIEEAD